MVVLYLSIYLCLRHMLCWVLLVLEILVVVGNYIALGPHSCKMKRIDTEQWVEFTFGVLCISSVSEIAWLWHMLCRVLSFVPGGWWLAKNALALPCPHSCKSVLSI